MGFIQRAVIETASEGALGLSLDRIRRNEDHGQFNPRPQFDPKQEAELRAQQRDGRTDEIYRQCLAHHGFVWYPVEQLPMLEGGVYRAEGEWRHRRLRLAFTPQDLTSGFPTAEALERYVTDQILLAKTRTGRVSKADLRKSRLQR